MGIPADPSKRSAKSKAPTSKAPTSKAPTSKAPTSKAPTSKAPTAKPPTSTLSASKAATPKISTPRKPRKPTPAAEHLVATRSDSTPIPISADERHQRIAVTAYFLAEARRFEPGHEQEDWFAAERLIGSAGAD